MFRPVCAKEAMPLRSDKLVGKAAFERTLDIVFTVSLGRIFQHALMEFDTQFIHNVWVQNYQASCSFCGRTGNGRAILPDIGLIEAHARLTFPSVRVSPKQGATPSRQSICSLCSSTGCSCFKRT